MLSRRSTYVAPLADAPLFVQKARRHLVVRVVLAATLVASLAAVLVIARDLDPEETAFLPRGANAVLVLDLSKSVEARGYDRVARVLQDVIAAKLPVGLVIFSDAPYELLPPGSPAEQLQPLLHYFQPRQVGGVAQYPPNPWQQGFSGGTSASGGVELAQAILRRDRVDHGSIVLVSDLDIPLSDVPRLTKTVVELRRENVAFRVVPLFPNLDARYVFERISGRDAFVDPRRLGRTESGSGLHVFAAPSPRSLVLASALLILVVALNELWCRRLQFGGVQA
jgi:hypothetical protein